MLEKGLNSELILRTVERKDGSIYKCVAKNEFGTDERTIKLVLLGRMLLIANVLLKLC